RDWTFSHIAWNYKVKIREEIESWKNNASIGVKKKEPGSWNEYLSLLEREFGGTGSSSLTLLSEIGLCLGIGSYLALNQSGMITARRSSWMVIPRPRASSLSKVNVCSPKATMTLYDIFLHATGFSNFLDFTILGSFELLCGTWQGARHIRIPPLRGTPRTFSRLCDWSRIFVMKKTRSRREVFVLVGLDGRVLCRG